MFCENAEDFLKFCSFAPEQEKPLKRTATKKTSSKPINISSDEEADKVVRNTQKKIRERKREEVKMSTNTFYLFI